MKLIKLAFISFFFIFLIITGISLLIPSHIRISRATNVAPGKASLLSLVRDTANWKRWHPALNDSGRVVQPLTIVPVSVSDSSFIATVQQGKKKPLENGFMIYSHASTDSLTLQWYMDFHLRWYPWDKFESLLYESTYGVMMEKGLANIKSLHID